MKFKVVNLKFMKMKKIYSTQINKLFFSLALIYLPINCFAINYYISNNGSDSNNGLNTQTPWQTLTKLNKIYFLPGDSILFQRGSTFYGSLTINHSGIKGNPIVFGAYGTGNNPVITGFTSVTNWTNLGNNIWESTNPVSSLSTCNVVSINSVNTNMGQFPNSNTKSMGYMFIQSYSGGYFFN